MTFILGGRSYAVDSLVDTSVFIAGKNVECLPSGPGRRGRWGCRVRCRVWRGEGREVLFCVLRRGMGTGVMGVDGF